MSLHFLHQKILRLLFIVSLLFSSNGCIYLLVGSVGALGGYVVSPDTVEGIIPNHDQESAWDSAVDIVTIMGIIQEQNPAAGILIAKIQGSKVVITTTGLGSSSTKLSVKARKAFMPKIRLAQDIYAKIVTHLEQ
ncbi:MAG: hypothetical protein NUV91_01395 [Candidatus Omnitrophica bacterium]|nr:hypothetical protein [Candidatus Omnitrophota bacterium]